MGNLKFNGVSTKDLGLVIQTHPDYTYPEKDLETTHIPGRNGDIIVDNNCWQNVDRVYSLASVFRPGTGFISNAESISKWLMSAKGYARLEDSYDPEIYRMAMCKASGTMSDYYGQATAIEVTFNCKPQRYLKTGETTKKYTGSSVAMSNPTSMSALPEITISGTTYSENDVMLVTVSNENSEVISTITLKEIPTSSVTINSELQTVYSEDGDNLSAYVGLNEKEFPELQAGKTTISVDKYTETTDTVEKYENLIDRAKQTCLCKYQPYDTQISSKSSTFYIKSYDMLKQANQEVYEAKAYGNLCTEKAETYTFQSFNSIMSAFAQVFSFNLSGMTKAQIIAMNEESVPAWMCFECDGADTDQPSEVRVKLLKTTDGDFITDLDGTNIGVFAASGNQIASYSGTGGTSSSNVTLGIYKTSTTNTITVYPAKMDNGSIVLDVDYTQISNAMPDWLAFKITYGTDASTGARTLASIAYLTNAEGYYYYQTSSLFGKKSKWHKTTAGTQTQLQSLNWSTSKKAFIYQSGLSTSSTQTFEYQYLSSLPQYDPVTTNETDDDGNVKKDENGNVITKVTNAVHFKVIEDGSTTDLSKISFKTIDAGYYRFGDPDNAQTQWQWIEADTVIYDSYGNLSTASTASNIIYYLASAPTYANEENWPEWLDPTPVKYDSAGVVYTTEKAQINPYRIDFKAAKAGWFRYQYTDSSDNTAYTSWTSSKQPIGNIIGKITPDERTVVHNHSENFTMHFITADDDTFPVTSYSYTDKNGNIIKDIAFFQEDGTTLYTNNTPPSWLTVELVKGTESDGSDDTIKYSTNQNGRYKWDSNTTWINKASGVEIVSGAKSDDTSVYFMAGTSVNDLPQYSLTNYTASITVDSSTGNPTVVTFKPKNAGYYMPGSETAWSYCDAGAEMIESKVSESTTIKRLQSKGEDLSGITIAIKPNWWKL